MRVSPCAIPEVKLIEPRRFADARGYFLETYNAAVLAEHGIDLGFIQDNQSLSFKRGTIRGLHFQVPPAAQAKIVRVLRGAVLDVAVDIRRGSPSYGRHVAVELTAESHRQLLIPAGFAHAFCTLVDDTEVAYKVSGPYAPRQEAGLRFDDPDLGIDWPVAPERAILNDKDRAWPAFADLPAHFEYAAEPVA